MFFALETNYGFFGAGNDFSVELALIGVMAISPTPVACDLSFLRHSINERGQKK